MREWDAGAMKADDCDCYHQLGAGREACAPRCPRGQREHGACVHLPMVVLLGLGGHFSKNALAPAEPVLAQMGLSPVAYAVISAVPVLGSFAFPTLWGMAYARSECLVTALVPAGILVSQLILVGGFAIWGTTAAAAAAQATLTLGLLLLSGFRAGGEVLQHTVLARLMPKRLTGGFAGLVVCTHLVVMLCNFAVPQAVADPEQPVRGLLRVQLLLLLPSAAGVLAAIWLLCRHDGWRSARAASWEHLPSESEAVEPQLDLECYLPPPPVQKLRSPWAGHLLIVWGALIVGLLHALQSVTNGLVVSFGTTPAAAGSVVARSQLVALCFLPAAGILGDMLGRRALLVFTSVLVVLATLTLAVATVWRLPGLLWQAALQALAMASVMAPVLPLALIPQNHAAPGKAYGMLDSLKSLTQASVMLLLGSLRQVGGFEAAITFVCLPLAIAGLGLSTILASAIEDVPGIECTSLRTCPVQAADD